MKWLISVAVAVAMVLGVVAMASPALALELPDPTALELPGVTLPDQCGQDNAPVFPSDDVQGPEDIEDDQTVVDIDDDQTVDPTTPGDVELPDFTLPDQCGQDNAPVFPSLEEIVDDDDIQTVSSGAVMTAS